MSKTIKLTQNQITIVDDDTYEWANKYKWCAVRWKNGFYAFRRIGKTGIALHRQILNPNKNQMVDHINGNGLDNRKCNLRVCSNKENQRNQKLQKINTSGYKGVSWHKLNKKWISSIKVDNKLIYLGYFINVKDAAKVYDVAAIKYFGEYAHINGV